MNRICLIGRLTRDPELRENENTTRTTFTLAVNRDQIKDGERQADFIDCIAWNKLAEIIFKHLNKGNQLGIEGRLQKNSYEDREGNTKYYTVVVVDKTTSRRI